MPGALVALGGGADSHERGDLVLVNDTRLPQGGPVLRLTTTGIPRS